MSVLSSLASSAGDVGKSPAAGGGSGGAGAVSGGDASFTSNMARGQTGGLGGGWAPAQHINGGPPPTTTGSSGYDSMSLTDRMKLAQTRMA